MPAPYPITERLFIRIFPPEACRAALAGLADDALEGVRWTGVAQLHLTLRFLGDVSEPMIDRLEAELACIRVEPFVLPLEGVGAFPPRGSPKILWAGVGTGHTRLFQLRQKVDDAVLAAGWTGELRSFEAHVTLGRAVGASTAQVDAWLRKHREFAGPSFRVENFDLVASDLGPEGALHRVRRTYLLKIP